MIMDYISFVDIENKKVYDIGKKSSAKYYLPYLAYKYQGNQLLSMGMKPMNIWKISMR